MVYRIALEKRKTRSTAEKAKRRKKPNEKTGRTVPQPSALETASSRDKTKHVSMSLHATWEKRKTNVVFSRIHNDTSTVWDVNVSIHQSNLVLPDQVPVHRQSIEALLFITQELLCQELFQIILQPPCQIIPHLSQDSFCRIRCTFFLDKCVSFFTVQKV